MLQDVKSAFRRSSGLSLLVLEERATPAVAVSYLPPIEQPTIVQVAVLPPASVVAPPVAAGDTSVRADLFGVGDTQEPTNELEEMLANDQAARMEMTGEPATQEQVTDDANDTSTVIIEDMVFVPHVE